MLTRLLVAVCLAVLAALAAWLLSRRRGPTPMSAPGWQVPDRLDRGDFDEPETRWLVALFSSATCESCQAVWERATVLASAEVVVQRVDVTASPELHRRYQIDAVPLVVLVDAQGVVRRHFLGPVTAADLWSGLAELRQG